MTKATTLSQDPRQRTYKVQQLTPGKLFLPISKPNKL